MASTPESCKVYTPPALAEAMTRSLGDETSARWLEPSVGSGVFLYTISRFAITPDRIVAIDIDEAPMPYDNLGTTIRGQDFISWSLSTSERFDRIIGNPPYIRICRLDESLKKAALCVREPDDTKMHLGANYWHVFVCACLSLLNPGGSLALVLPASWDYADYSTPLRNMLPKLFRSIVVHRSLRPLFGTVSDGSVVLVAKGYRKQPEHYARHVHANMPALIQALEVAEQGTASIGSQVEHEDTGNELISFNNIADILIGAVTGDAKYFLMTEKQRLERELPEDCCKPILTRARHLQKGKISLDDWKYLKDEGHRVWLFSPSDNLLSNDAVRAYLELSADKNGPNKSAYWLKKRKPWYRVELPLQPHGFMSGMRNTGPWICMNLSPELTASNTLYVVRFREGITEDERYGWALSMLTSLVAVQLKKSCRLYPDGLKKFEPSDLKKLKLPKPTSFVSARELYLKAVSHLLSGEVDKARAVADKWFTDQSDLDQMHVQLAAESQASYEIKKPLEANRCVNSSYS